MSAVNKKAIKTNWNTMLNVDSKDTQPIGTIGGRLYSTLVDIGQISSISVPNGLYLFMFYSWESIGWKLIKFKVNEMWHLIGKWVSCRSGYVSHDPRGKIVPLLYFSKFCNLRARIILLIFQRQL